MDYQLSRLGKQRKPRYCLMLASLLCLFCFWADAHRAYAQNGPPKDPLVMGSAWQEPSDLSISNEYLRVDANQRGQFIIRTTGGDPDVADDNDKPLLYSEALPDTGLTSELWTSFSTFRYCAHISTGCNWSYDTSHEASSATYQRVREGRLITMYGVGSYIPCTAIVRRTIEFVENPLTGREDMVEISFRFFDNDYMLPRPVGAPATICTTAEYLTAREDVGVRLMLDTMIGENDDAPFYVPSTGYTSNQHDFPNGNIPDYFRVFESESFSSGLQAVGILDVDTSNTARPDRFLIANWENIFAWSDNLDPKDKAMYWDITPEISTPHGDSAVAIYWDSIRLGSTNDTMKFRYGLAPRVDGEKWLDAPVIVDQMNRYDCFFNLVNRSNEPYTGGVAQLNLPAGLAVASVTVNGASLAPSQTITEAIGDLAVGASIQIHWQIEATGGPGTYVYSVESTFASGQTFNVQNQVVVQQAVGFSAQDYVVDEDSGSIELVVERFNSSGQSLEIDYIVNAGTATLNSDYALPSDPLIFAATETTKTLRIPILDDELVEGSEVFSVTISTNSDAVKILHAKQAIVTIADNDGNAAQPTVYLPLIIKHEIVVEEVIEEEPAYTLRCNASGGSGGLAPGIHEVKVAGANAVVVVGEHDPSQPTYLAYYLHGQSEGEYRKFRSSSNRVTQLIRDRGWIFVAPEATDGVGWGIDETSTEDVDRLRAVLDEMTSRYNVCRDLLLGSAASGGAYFWDTRFFPEAGVQYPAFMVMNCGAGLFEYWISIYGSGERIRALAQSDEIRQRTKVKYVYGTEDFLLFNILASIDFFRGLGFDVIVEEKAEVGHCEFDVDDETRDFWSGIIDEFGVIE